MNKTPPESAKKTLSQPIKVEANFNLEGFAEDIDRQDMEEGKGIERDGLLVRVSPDKLRKRRETLRMNTNQEVEPMESVSILSATERSQE
jgi:hypothetical protein